MTLTMPAAGLRCCRIVVDGQDVGFAAAVPVEYDGSEWTEWSAGLWARLDDPEGADEQVTRPTLRELRAELRRKLVAEGPWWEE